MTADCIFCQIVAGTTPSHRVYEDEYVIGFLDIYPKTKGHSLVIPKVHVKDIFDISAQTLSHIIIASQHVAKSMQRGLGADGINLLNSSGGAAQQDVFHYHIHVIPRYVGSGQKFSFATSYTDNTFSDTASTIRQFVDQ